MHYVGPSVTGVALTVAFAAALCYALAAAVQQRQAESAAARGGSMLAVAGLVRRPIWLFGFTVGSVGIALHAVALRWATRCPQDCSPHTTLEARDAA